MYMCSNEDVIHNTPGRDQKTPRFVASTHRSLQKAVNPSRFEPNSGAETESICNFFSSCSNIDYLHIYLSPLFGRCDLTIYVLLVNMSNHSKSSWVSNPFLRFLQHMIANITVQPEWHIQYMCNLLCSFGGADSETEATCFSNET